MFVQVKRPASPDIIEVEREVRMGKSVQITPKHFFFKKCPNNGLVSVFKFVFMGKFLQSYRFVPLLLVLYL